MKLASNMLLLWFMLGATFVLRPTTSREFNTYCHDFGSILNFIEYAFGLTQGGIGDPRWPYADQFAMDYNPNDPGSYSLSDFFTFTQANYHAFQPINGAKYPPSCFHSPKTSQCFGSNYPDDPDGDANESD